MSFLDTTNLTYLWGKIKAAFVSKSGDSEIDGTLGVDTLNANTVNSGTIQASGNINSTNGLIQQGGVNLWTEVNPTVTWTGSLSSGSTHDFQQTYTFPTGYSKVLGVRGIRTNHETAMTVTAWSVTYSGTSYTVYARCRALAAVSSNANTVTFYILLGAQ